MDQKYFAWSSGSEGRVATVKKSLIGLMTLKKNLRAGKSNSNVKAKRTPTSLKKVFTDSKVSTHPTQSPSIPCSIDRRRSCWNTAAGVPSAVGHRAEKAGDPVVTSHQSIELPRGHLLRLHQYASMSCTGAWTAWTYYEVKIPLQSIEEARKDKDNW